MRVRSKSLLLLLGISMASLSPLSAQQKQPADSVADLRAAFVQTLQQQDVDASVALFTPDATFLTPDGARYDDRAAIRTLYRSVVAQFRSRITMTSKHLETSDRVCADEGTYMETLTPVGAGKPLAVAGSYIFVATRQPDGAWKISEMVWTGGVH